ncbi:MAG: glucosamine-6-phosphate deaminase [Planctomycetota bacterium]|jgi:glucosamine-6-phosphate deaminase
MTAVNRTVMGRRERIATTVLDQSRQVSLVVANEIAELIRRRRDEVQTCVLGLATGSTPMTVYHELVRMHREEDLSFAHVIVFNLDEYFPMRREALQSYHRFMQEHLFEHVDIDPANVHIPDGEIPPEDVAAHCDAYEAAIRNAGGIDLQLLGIGRTGHIGFNEPGSARSTRTRLITLDRVTRKDAASDFFGEENVPRRAMTMGVGTILDARRVLLMAFGEQKADVIAQAVEGPVTASVPASFLQEHPSATVYLDRAAAASLTRFRCPWIVGAVSWDDRMIRQAVIWLARELDKPILKLTDEDYNEHHLQDLLAAHGPAYDINLQVFRALQRTITGWPGGKPNESARVGAGTFPKRAVIFSPHPDDDVISMGGTLIRLVDQGHDVHVAYQTSGSIAVFDADATRFADFATEFNRAFGIDHRRAADLEDLVSTCLRRKTPGQVDSPEVQQIKALIRRGEARAAGRYCGLPLENLHFLDMPFYETGRVRKKPLGEDDIRLIVDLLESVQPHLVYAAGDLSDPHGTHRTCLAAVRQAIERVRDESWFGHCEVWLYRGAWQEWGPEQIDMAVPLSPKELQRKITAIFKHESQKDKALFPGADEREFWQRAEQRNRATARLYDALGLAEYEAIEAFVRWGGEPLPS